MNFWAIKHALSWNSNEHNSKKSLEYFMHLYLFHLYVHLDVSLPIILEVLHFCLPQTWLTALLLCFLQRRLQTYLNSPSWNQTRKPKKILIWLLRFMLHRDDRNSILTAVYNIKWPSVVKRLWYLLCNEIFKTKEI